MAGVRTVPAPLAGPWTTINGPGLDGSHLDGSQDVVPLELMAVAGQGGTGRHVILARPRIRRLPGGERVLSISFVLSRPPAPHEPLADLVREAVLGLEIGVTPPAEVCQRLTAQTGVKHAPLFVRRTSLRLTYGSGRVLAENSVDTESPALSATLDRAESLALLDAVRGRQGPLSLEVEAAYRAAAPEPAALRLEFDLSVVWDALSALASGDDVWLSAAHLSGVLTELIRTGQILVGPIAAPAPEVAAELMPEFERGLRPILHSTRAGYELNVRPPDGTWMTLTHRYQSSGQLATVRLSVPMHEVLSDALAGTDVDRYVKPVTVGTDGPGTVPVPKLLHTKSLPAPPAMVVADGRVTTAWNAARPSGAALPAAHAVLAASRPDLLANRLSRWNINDLAFDLKPDGEPRPGPIITGESGPWRDRHDEDRYWYPPTTTLVIPEPRETDPAKSPFLFTFRTVGHSTEGRPALHGQVRVTLTWAMAADTKAEWERLGSPPTTPVPVEHVSVELLVPYRDPSGNAKVQAIRASSVEDTGSGLVATIELTDQWARVAYGALAVPGFQEGPAQVSVAYTFGGWVPISPANVHGAAALHLTPVAVAVVRERLWHLPNHSVIRPQVTVRPEIVAALKKRRYGWRTHGRTQNLDIGLPCATFGALYVEETGPAPRSVGCREAYQLGHAPSRIYERVDVAAAPAGTKVLRLLTSPDRFVVVPEAYRIGRYESAESGRAYRPAITLYSTIDVDEPTNIQCVLSAGLQPDLAADRRLLIERELREKHHPAPVVEQVTELPATVTFDWALPQSAGGVWSAHVNAVRSWDGFQVTVTTNAAGILALQAILAHSGIHGSATMTLADGTPLDIKLDLQLSRIVGPWSTGPVSMTREGSQAVLRNEIDAEVMVGDMIAIGPGDAIDTVPVEATLAPHAQHRVTLAHGVTRAVPVTTVRPTPASLAEIRAYVEDISVDVIFVNLVDLAQRQLNSIEVTAGIRGIPGQQAAAITTEGGVQSMRFVLALTALAADPVLEYRIRLAGGPSEGEGELRMWRLSTQGHVVTLTWEMIT